MADGKLGASDEVATLNLIIRADVRGSIEAIVKELGKGNRLEFRDFGVFETKLRKARKAQNPKTLEPVAVHFEQLEGFASDFVRDHAVVFHLCHVAHAPEDPVRDARRSA